MHLSPTSKLGYLSFKGVVHIISSHSYNEGLNNIKTGVKKEFLKGVLYNRNSDVYIWYMVASWVREVTVIFTQ